ncbi:RNA polymerase sigma factor [Microbacterium sp.]|uniref:RNA polymerase sigma factor n=1 Tax=Microbacterium sp. TaxID=51671 RepID=UPI0027374BCD|nr:RNA polymerase sigma factor [Microbacterium sp.]MDP3952036.1 RNA polymerase sigma factor [Microbacterium sp.]
MSRRRMDDRQSRGVDNISTNATDLLAYFEYRARGAETADLLSETMATAWRRIDAMPDDSTQARMWLFGIARNILANAERAAQRRWKLADKLRAHLTTATPLDDDQRTIEVRDAVSRLTPELRELVGLIHWDGFSIADAAGIIGIPASTARTRYQTARQQLARTLTSVDPLPDVSVS